MTHFDPKFFRKYRPTKEQMTLYMANAWRDYQIAKDDEFQEVRFNYTYQALIKGGIALLAKTAGVKVRSVPGHHVKILEKMSEILENPDVNTVGNMMRMKRNLDLYEGGISVGEAEVIECIKFVEVVLDSIERVLQKN